eukprot:1480173-Prymnesium_polylepis.2
MAMTPFLLRAISLARALQDQMRVVKTRLLEMLPDAKVFLGALTRIIPIPRPVRLGGRIARVHGGV